MSKLPFAAPNGRPLTRGGLGHSACWISGGRCAAGIAEHGGLEEIVWFGDQPPHRQALFSTGFRSAYARIFRAQLLVGERAWTLGMDEGALHPSGWSGRMRIATEGLELEFAILCRNNALIQAVRVLANPRRHTIGMRLVLRDHLRVQAERRTWGAWTVRGGVAGCTVVDQPAPKRDDAHSELNAGQVAFTYPDDEDPRTTHIALIGDGAIAMRPLRGQRQFSIAPARRSELGMALVFAVDEAALKRERAAMKPGVAAQAWRAMRAWAAAEQVAPRASGLSPEVVSFAQQMPALIRAAMPADLPGAMRASYNAYWVWGWDTLVHAHTYLLNGIDDLLAPALDLYVRTAHPDHGIGHAFDQRMRPLLTQQLPAQGLFTIAAWQLWSLRGDLGPARRHWSFIRSWLARCRTLPQRDGLFVGMSLVPDFPQDAGQDGHDLSPFNNGIMYQACRCIEGLASSLGDAATAHQAALITAAMRQGFTRRLWDPSRGFWNDSVRSTDFARRPSYAAHALLWVTPFCRELVAHPEAAAAFAETHLRTTGGIRPYPAWDPAFNADGNQLAQHYAVGQDPLYGRLMAMTGRQERLREWLRWKDQLWGNLTVPEGVSLDAENDGPVRPDHPGGRQMFAAKAWSDVLLGAILGISLDPGGLTAEPGLDGAQTWSGIAIRGRRWSVRVQGSGPYIAGLSVGGTAWSGTCKVPLPARGPAEIVIRRSRTAPRGVQLLSADGAEVLAATGGRAWQVRLRTPAATAVRLRAPRRPRLLLDDQAVSVAWDGRQRLATLWLEPGEHRLAVASR